MKLGRLEIQLSMSLVLLALMPGPMAIGATSTKVSGQISSVGDATHLEFSGQSSWDYSLKKIGSNRVQITLPAFSQKTVVDLKSWSDRHIERVKVDQVEGASKYTVTFELKSSDVESFDYLTDEPSRLIIDFFKQAKVAEAPAKSTKSTVAKIPKALPAKKSSSKKRTKKKSKVAGSKNKKSYKHKGKGRRIASDELLVADPAGEYSGTFSPGNSGAPERGIFDAADPDYQRFAIKNYEIDEDAIIASRQNVYIRFPMLKMPSSRLDELLANAPEYVIKPKDKRENKEARLLTSLFYKKKWATFLKTFRYFTNKYQNSNYDEIVRNMAAEVHYSMWKEDGDILDYEKAKSEYTYLLKKYPDSILSERSSLILAYTALERGNGLGSIQLFVKFLEEYPRSSERDWAQKALAEGYLILNKYDDAYRTYSNLEKNYIKNIASAEATYRKGDVHFAKKDYQASVDAYRAAIKKFPGYQNVFPNAYYNIAESLFWLGKYKESLDNYLTYVRLFPQLEHGGYALTRIGELLEILGADKSRSMGAFLESYFRFRKSEGANVARIRMLSQRMKGMKDKELRKSLAELDKMAKSSSLPRVAEFITIMTAEGFHGRNEYQKSIDHLVSYYQKNPTAVSEEAFRKRILASITDSIHEKLLAGSYMDVLQQSSSYSTTWLNNVDRFDVPYFIAKAYEQAGVFSESEKAYRETLDKLTKIRGSRELRERRVTEHLPTEAEVLIRLAAVAVRQRNYSEAYGYLSKVKASNKLRPESEIERVSLQSDIAEKRGNLKGAVKGLKQLVSTWKDEPKLLAGTYLKLGKLLKTSKKFGDGLRYVTLLEDLADSGQEVSEDIKAKSMSLKGDLLLAMGHEVEAVESYLSLLKGFEEKRPIQSVRYKAGKILFNKGDLNAAEKVWAGLNGDDGKMYRRLAKEKLEEAKWQAEYKRYMNRIPAAADIQ